MIFGGKFREKHVIFGATFISPNITYMKFKIYFEKLEKKTWLIVTFLWKILPYFGWKDLSFLRRRYKLEYRESKKKATWSNLYFLTPSYILWEDYAKKMRWKKFWAIFWPKNRQKWPFFVFELDCWGSS